MQLVYLIGVRLYTSVVRLSALWNPKAKKWVKGRKDVWQQLQDFERLPDEPLYWFHCASLGEFEQGRPLMERIKKELGGQLVITFFSPSGYEIRKDYELADLIVYLPIENQQNVNRFYEFVQPTSVFFVKYEFWATYILKAKSLDIPIYSISAVFRKKQLFFKVWGGYMRKILRQFDAIFVQNKASKELLSTVNISSILAGDTRYDRVMMNAENVKSFPEIERFRQSKSVFVIGSSWADDEKVLFPFINNTAFKEKVIIAPHEIDESRIQAIERGITKSTIRYSELAQQTDIDADVLIIDNIGMLMHLYQYADMAYVGGAFGTGLHNILEPACFGVPVIFGPDHQKFHEAGEFIENGIGVSVANLTQLEKAYEQLSLSEYKGKIRSFMKAKTGATELIYNHVFNKR
jgi:3-deoxy-D-manno-octulosonic-acid transferase